MKKFTFLFSSQLLHYDMLCWFTISIAIVERSPIPASAPRMLSGKLKAILLQPLQCAKKVQEIFRKTLDSN